MSIQQLCSKHVIEPILRRDPFLHLYELGDLDDFFWPRTTWYTFDSPTDQPIALVYSGMELPVILLLSREPLEPARELLRALAPSLPERIYAHLTPGMSGDLLDLYDLSPHGLHLKMAQTNPELCDKVDVDGTFRLSPQDLAELMALYAEAYPGNWFDPRMLETGQTYGYRADGRLVAVAGVHVYSPTYRVAALGNITTHPEFRGRGLALRVTARLCHELRDVVDAVGLNVESINASAIACYRRLGFTDVALYEEIMLVRR